jgi:proteasome lid subunit RPN8/RPN11
MSLYITATAREHIIHDAVATFPDECCGFLYGTESGDERTITEIDVCQTTLKKATSAEDLK